MTHLHPVNNADELHERRIQKAKKRLDRATTHLERRRLWAEFKQLVNTRSAAQVRRMEREQGLI